MSQKDVILILDFGSQYTQLIARRVRELGVFCEIAPYNVNPQKIRELVPQGIILSGGPETITDSHSPRAPDIVFELSCPVLGICYGMQTMAAQLGGKVATGSYREFGLAHIEQCGDSKLLKGMEQASVWMSHNDHVVELPTGFNVIAKTPSLPIAAIAHEHRRWYGLQFHPEVTQTVQGSLILQRFVRDICNCRAEWNAQHILRELQTSIQTQVAGDEVILGLSGGVDSLVAATLIHRVIGKKLRCIFIDNGFLRSHDRGDVAQYAQQLGLNIEIIDASDQFLAAVKNISEPEQKRKIIGREFIKVFERCALQFSHAQWLAQGTIYSDVIESAHGSKAHVIKSHHNVGGLPEKMNLKLLEPLRMLFKDEVRKLGLELGLPREMVYRHPFPGPGLALRILGEIKPNALDLLRKADALYIDQLRKHGLYDTVSQAFAVYLPVSSVGVMGDQRKYEPVIALRAVNTEDFMTARFARLPWDFLEETANRIVNDVPGISRVVYDISGKPPATIEWE